MKVVSPCRKGKGRGHGGVKDEMDVKVNDDEEGGDLTRV
jgi:hypothetical protein